MPANRELTQQVKEYALECGVDLVGIASVDRFDGAPAGFHPTDVMKSTRSVIVIARKFLMGILDELAPGKQRLSYKHHMYVHLNHHNSSSSFHIGRFLEKKGYQAFAVQPTTPYHAHEFRGVMSHRHAAVRAGLGVFGKNNLLLTKEFGPRQRFGTVLTDAELIPDPLIEENLCLNCNLCREACPVQAWDAQSGIFYKPVCAHHQNWNRGDQECKQPCGICIQVCPLGTTNERRKKEEQKTIPLWRMYSGIFAGYRSEDRMFDASGRDIGYFDGRLLFSLMGQCIGEMYDGKWIGKRVNVGYPFGSCRDAGDPIACVQQEDCDPLRIEGWEDSPYFLSGKLGVGRQPWDN